MDCRTAQTMIQKFINYELDDDETMRFIRHMRECPKCNEELEVQYTMTHGLRQLENGEILTSDFSRELQEDMDDRYTQIDLEQRREKSVSLYAAAFLITLCAILFFYGLLIR